MIMLKVLGAQIKEFKKDSILTPVFMILEVIMEMIIPLLMASIIDDGVDAGDLNHIYKVGGIMIVMALIGLWAGLMGQSSERGLPQALHATSGRQCTKIFRRFHFRILTSTPHQA